MGIPFVDLKAPNVGLMEDLTEALRSVVDRAAYTLGDELRGFEASFARYCGCAHAVGVSSGTDALKLALIAAGVGFGDEVIMPANTFIATAEAASHIGATPVFVDCLPDTANMDPEGVGAAITELTKAVVPVHLYGQPADMDSIGAIARSACVSVVEDACQAHGARYKGRLAGSIGVAAAFSFYPGKNLGALGDGGAVTSSDALLAERVAVLRNHGQIDKYTHAEIGYCDRLHNLQAAFLSLKLAYLDTWNQARRKRAAQYDQLLEGVDGVFPIRCAPEVEHVYHLYVVRVSNRDAVKGRLAEAGIETGVHYPVPLHLTPAYARLGYARGDFPVAESLGQTVLSLPMHPHLTDAQVEEVAERLVLAVAMGS